MAEKKEIVRKGYDIIAEEYQAHRHIFAKDVEVLEEFTCYLPKNARILDAGCGAGPSAHLLVQAGFEVVGVDFSIRMLSLAQKHVPDIHLIHADLTSLGCRDNTFDGLVALYAIIHIPRNVHTSLFNEFHRILKPDGILLLCTGSSDWEGEGDYFGVNMFWSHYSPEATLQMVNKAGIQILSGKPLVIGGETHYWILGRNSQ